MEKMNPSTQATVRSNLYSLVEKTVNESGFVTEPVTDGMLVHLEDGNFAKIRVSVCDPVKFDLEEARKAFAEKTAKAAARASAASERAKAAEEKATARATKAAEKVQ